MHHIQTHTVPTHTKRARTTPQELLKSCGRAHDLADVYRAVEVVQSSGMPTWSLDLISGLPQLTMSKWQHSLREAIKAGPSHISVYDLQVRRGVAIRVWW